MEKRKWLIGACALTLALGGLVRGQINPILGYGFTAPVLALPGQTISVCAFNWQTGPVAAGPVTVTEQIVDVPLGAAIAQQSITLPISPFDPYHPSPCLQFKVPAAATSPAGPGELFSGAIMLYPAPTTGSSSDTTPPALITASVNVSGSSVQTIPITIQTVATSSVSAIRPFRGLPMFVAP
jgi:hypothetical protein